MSTASQYTTALDNVIASIVELGIVVVKAQDDGSISPANAAYVAGYVGSLIVTAKTAKNFLNGVTHPMAGVPSPLVPKKETWTPDEVN